MNHLNLKLNQIWKIKLFNGASFLESNLKEVGFLPDKYYYSNLGIKFFGRNSFSEDYFPKNSIPVGFFNPSNSYRFNVIIEGNEKVFSVSFCGENKKGIYFDDVNFQAHCHPDDYEKTISISIKEDEIEEFKNSLEKVTFVPIILTEFFSKEFLSYFWLRRNKESKEQAVGMVFGSDIEQEEIFFFSEEEKKKFTKNVIQKNESLFYVFKGFFFELLIPSSFENDITIKAIYFEKNPLFFDFRNDGTYFPNKPIIYVEEKDKKKLEKISKTFGKEYGTKKNIVLNTREENFHQALPNKHAEWAKWIKPFCGFLGFMLIALGIGKIAKKFFCSKKVTTTQTINNQTE